MSRVLQNILLAFVMATSVTGWFQQANFAILDVQLWRIPLFLIAIFLLSLFIVDDVRNSFKKVLWYEKREDKRPIWQVGIGMIFFFAQIGFVEIFARGWMGASLDGMPLYIIFSFMNAFLATVIFEELFYKEERTTSQFKFKKLK